MRRVLSEPDAQALRAAKLVETDCGGRRRPNVQSTSPYKKALAGSPS